MNVVTITGVKKLYKMGSETVAALNGVDLRIDAGEFVALMGPSGSGKSTLMNILGCLDRPTLGSYKLLGKEVSGLSDEFGECSVACGVCGLKFKGKIEFGNGSIKKSVIGRPRRAFTGRIIWRTASKSGNRARNRNETCNFNGGRTDGQP